MESLTRNMPYAQPAGSLATRVHGKQLTFLQVPAGVVESAAEGDLHLGAYASSIRPSTLEPRHARRLAWRRGGLTTTHTTAQAHGIFAVHLRVLVICPHISMSNAKLQALIDIAARQARVAACTHLPEPAGLPCVRCMSTCLLRAIDPDVIGAAVVVNGAAL